VSAPNWRNRTLWTGDNLDIMRGMNAESVDLIYLDPPFNSNRDYAAPVGSEAAGAAFKDTWTLDDVDEAWHGLIAEQEPALYRIIDAAGLAHGKGMKSYLIMMAARMLELRRLLKPTGSLYLHCDPTASHYLKLLLDAIVGGGNFAMRSHGGERQRKGLRQRALRPAMTHSCSTHAETAPAGTHRSSHTIPSMCGSSTGTWSRIPDAGIATQI